MGLPNAKESLTSGTLQMVEGENPMPNKQMRSARLEEIRSRCRTWAYFYFNAPTSERIVIDLLAERDRLAALVEQVRGILDSSAGCEQCAAAEAIDLALVVLKGPA